MDRFQGDLEDAEFDSAARRLESAEKLRKEAGDAGFALEIPEDCQIGRLRQRLAARQKEIAEDKAYRQALKDAQSPEAPDETVKIWEAFVNAFPDGKFAVEGKDSLAKARQAAKDWHDAEYERAMKDANGAKESKDFGKASQAKRSPGGASGTGFQRSHRRPGRSVV